MKLSKIFTVAIFLSTTCTPGLAGEASDLTHQMLLHAVIDVPQTARVESALNTGAQDCGTETVGDKIDLCGFDPSERICANLPSDIVERFSATEMKMYDLSDKLSKGAVLAAQPEFPGIKAHVQEAVNIFRSMIDQVPYLNPKQRDRLKGIIATCPDDIHLDGLALGLNADVQNFDNDKVPYDRCSLGLSNKMLIECAEGSAVCFGTLFHEFGHMLNSCRYLVANQLKVTHWWEFSSPYFSPEDEALGEALERVGQCYTKKGISSPHFGIVNTCESKNQLSDDLRSRCGIENDRDHPSQLLEAQADFWGAAAFSLWLNQNHKSPDGRRHGFIDFAGQWCLMK